VESKIVAEKYEKRLKANKKLKILKPVVES